MFSEDLIRAASGGKVTPRHQIRFTCPGRYRADVGDTRVYMTFLGQNPDGSRFVVQDCGGQMELDQHAEMEKWCDELNEDHAAFVAWWPAA